MVNSKFVGISIMMMAVILFVVGYAFTLSAEQALLVGHQVDSSGQCLHDPSLPCPYVELHKLSVYQHTGLFADLILFSFGVWLFAQRKPEEKALSRAKRAAHGLGGDEAKTFDFILQTKGFVFQHELVKHMDVSKVRMTRILDKLESQGLIERRRRGMANIIVLK